MEKIGPTKVLMAAFEAVPFAKTGGLGDVAGSLPKYLKKEGVDIRVIMPKFLSIPEKYVQQMEFLCSFTVSVGWRNQYCGIRSLEKEDILGNVKVLGPGPEKKTKGKKIKKMINNKKELC